MRRCRKLISMIVMMAMLATMTPYQALATEATPGSTTEAAAVVEETQEQDTDMEETVPEDQEASDEALDDEGEKNEAASEGGTETSAEAALTSDAEDNSSIDTDANPNEDEMQEENGSPVEGETSEPAAAEEGKTEEKADPENPNENEMQEENGSPVEGETSEPAVAEEVQAEEKAYPAFVLKDVAVDGTDITISVDAPEGAFPEGILMRVSLEETPKEVLEAANAELANEAAQVSAEQGEAAQFSDKQEEAAQESAAATGAEVTQEDAVTFNIEFYLPEDPETEIEPLVPISVTFGNIALEGDTLEVYHSDDSQEGEVEVEKVLDGVANTDVLTVEGLEKFSDYTVLVKKNLLGAADNSFELEVTVTPEGDSPITLTEDGVPYESNNRSKKYTIHFHAKYPTAANKELEIQLPYGMAWASGYHSGWSFAGHETETWYQEVSSYTRPDQQTDPAKQSHYLNTTGMMDGALTIHWKEGLESVEFEFVVATTEVNDLAQTGLSFIEDAILVSLSYDNEVKKTVRMNLEQPHLELIPAKYQYGIIEVDDENRIKVLEDGSNTNSIYFGAVPETTGGHVYQDEYELWMETPAGVVWEKSLSLSNVQETTLGTPILHQAGEELILSDGTTYTIPEGKQVYIFSRGTPGRIQAPAAANRAFGPIWNFPKDKFPAGTEVTIRMLDARMKYWMSDTCEQYDRSLLPEQKYIIVAPEEEIYINTGISGPRSAYTDGNTLSFGVQDFKYTQEELAGVFRIGNRKIGDSRPKQMTYLYDVNNTGAGGITEQALYSIINDPVYGTTTSSNFKVKLWKPGEPGTETDWITVSDPSGGSIRMTEVPGWSEGYYLRAIQCKVDRIPALSQKDMDGFYGVELSDTPLTTRTFLSTLTIEDLPDSGYTDTVTGGQYTFFSGKTIIPAYTIDNNNGERTIYAGETKQLRFRINGGNRTNYIDEIYLISPYGDPYTNIKAEVPINNRSFSGYTAAEAVVTEIDAAYGDGSFQPSSAFTAKYPNARVYKLDFTEITEIHEMYLSRQYGMTDATAKAQAEDEMSIANSLSSMLWISFTMEANTKDPSGTTEQDLMWVKVWRPDDLSNVTFASLSGAPFVPDIYNLTGNTETLLHKGIDITVYNKEEVQVIPAVKKTTDPDDKYQTWDETEDTIVRTNQDLDYRLEILNTSTSIAKGLQVYIPIPKKGEFWGNEFQKTGEPFEYNLSLAGPATLPDNYEVAYAKNADPSNQHDTWNGYDWTTDVSGWTDADWEDVNFVRIVYTGDTGIAPGEDVYAYMSMHTAEYDETDILNDVKNIWRPYYLRELSGVSAFRTGETVASALKPAKISGTVFKDLKNDGTYDPEDSDLPDTGIAAVKVEAWREVDGTLTKIDSTETDENGYYLFENLIEGKEYTIIVTNPDTDTYFKFSVNGPASTRFAPEQDQSKAAAAETAKVTETGTHIEVDCGLLQELKVPVTKIWADGTNQDGVRPESIQVKLKGTVEAESDGGEPEEKTVVEKTQTLTAADADEEDETGNTWIYTFEGLTAYEKGKEISYSVEETKTAVITGTDGPGTYKIDVQGSVEEGFEITNTHTPEVRDITVTKAWEDYDDMNSRRPDSITVQLYAGDSAYEDPVTLSGSEGWTYTWENLYTYKNGSKIQYTVDEAAGVPGYKKADTIEGDMETGFTITNILVVTEADAQKVWSNADETATAPVGASVTFTLYADGEATDLAVTLDGTADEVAPTVTGCYESEPWKASFVKLPKCQAGTDTPVVYTIAETSGYTGYTASTTDPVESGASVTNTQDVTSLKVTKVWEDAGDQDGKRPETITVKLLADGEEEQSQEITIDRDTDEYEYTFTNLPIYVTDEEGVQHKVVYDVAEEEITTGDYSAVYEVINAEGTKEQAIEIKITNNYTPEQTSVTVNKLWDDAEDQDAVRPESIQVQLYSGDTELQEPVTLTAEDGWTYTWEELDKYSPHGNKIVYSVKEVETVPEYEAEILEIDDTNKIIINNKHEVYKTNVTVSKTWEDDNDKMGARPAELLVTLYADGEAVEEATLNNENSWKYTFTDLNVNKIVDGKGGNAIVYTVEEEAVNAYFGNTVKTEDTDGITYAITNTYAPAKHDPPVKKVITGDTPGETETFNFTITPVSNTAGVDKMPMPNNEEGSSKTVQIEGEGEVEFGIITFNVPGQYIYEVVETVGSNSDYTYDGSTYQIIYDVTEGEDSLQASRRYLKDGSEVEEIVFTNEYKEPTKPSKPSEPTKPSKPSRSNNTGDSANGALWALLLLLAGGALAGTIWYRRRKKV